MKSRMASLTALAAFAIAGSASASAVLFTDNFDVTQAALDPNSEIANPGRQGGTLATPTLGYLFSGNVQVGNPTNPPNTPSDPGDDLLVAYSGIAYVNYDFSNQTGPVEITFRGLVNSLNTDPASWVSVSVGTNAGGWVNAANVSSILFRANGGTELWNHGSATAGASGYAPGLNVWTDYKVVLSDTAGTGSAWGSGGSRADYYSNGSYLGTMNITQLTAGEGYIGLAAGGFISGYDNLTITALTANTDYATWAASFTPPIGLPAADDDNDGLSNQQEYAFGLLPNSGSSVNPIAVPLNKTTGTFTYTRRDPVTKATGLTYTIWTSTNLVNWTQETNLTAVQTPGTPDGNGIQQVVVTLTPTPTAPKFFVQVRAN